MSVLLHACTFMMNVPGENECQKGTEEPGNGVTDCELLRESWKANSGPL